MKQDCIKGNRIALPKIGDVKMILHRPIPDGFKIKTAQIVKVGDGYYVTLTLQDVISNPVGLIHDKRGDCTCPWTTPD